MNQVGSPVHRVKYPYCPRKINVPVIFFLPHELYLGIHVKKSAAHPLLDQEINLSHKIRCPFYRYPGRPLMVHKKGPHRFYQLNDPFCVYLHMFYLLQPHNPGHIAFNRLSQKDYTTETAFMTYLHNPSMANPAQYKTYHPSAASWP